MRLTTTSPTITGGNTRTSAAENRRTQQKQPSHKSPLITMEHKFLSAFTPEYNVLSSDKTTLTFNVHLRAPEVQNEGKRSTVALSAVIDT